MRILHVGFGFSPWIVNGLVLYAEDLMEGQAQSGKEVGYFFAARQLPRLRRPRLHRWTRKGVTMFEWLNSSVVVGRDLGTADPERDLQDPPTETGFARVLTEFRPDVVHVQDLGGLPSSILDVARARGLPVVMTLHDYQALCPTIKLYDADGQNCCRSRPGEMCVVCCSDAPIDNFGDLRRTELYTRAQIRARVPFLDAALRRPAIERVGNVGLRIAERISGLSPGAGQPPAHRTAETRHRPQVSAGAYNRRRVGNVERLNRLDRLITPSAEAGEVWRGLGVRAELIQTLPFNPAHLEQLGLKRRWRPGVPMRFALLNGASSTEKGADLVVDALSELSARGLERRFRLAVYGLVAPHVRRVLAAHPAVDIRGEYRTDELDRILEQVDVGLMPSVWQEVYGFAGLEFLAKGIPVIGNARGGIPAYVRPDQTGWLNRSCTAAELADLMQGAVEDPDVVARLGRTAGELRDQLIRPFHAQLADLDRVYAEVVSAGRDTAPNSAPAGHTR